MTFSQFGFKSPLIFILFSSILLYILFYTSNYLSKHHRSCLEIAVEQRLETNGTLPSDPTKLGGEEEEEVDDDDNVGEEAGSIIIPEKSRRYNTTIRHIAFGISASSTLWQARKEYIKVWWRPKVTRGVVWLDKKVNISRNDSLPRIKVSSDTSQFGYNNPEGDRSALRLARVVTETFKLGLKNVRWFVMGDDDTIFAVDNLVRLLSKYDHNQFYYIGSPSESHVQNMHFTYAMAFGGGGFAISYPLAVELAKMHDDCIMRYPMLYGSDDRTQACMAEIGVPLTKEQGFHQNDLRGEIVGLLGAHPVAPLITLHHIDALEPVFPGMTRVEALRHLFESVKLDSASIVQQSICYDRKRLWSISVSWGYVVQIARGAISPRELEQPIRTFVNWYRMADYIWYEFNSRPVAKNPCQKPFVFYMKTNQYDPQKNQTTGVYSRFSSVHPYCHWKMASPEKIQSVVVYKKLDPFRWNKSPRRDCCRVLPSNKTSTLHIEVGECAEGEISEMYQ